MLSASATFSTRSSGIHADHLRRSARRIGERTEQVEDCPQAKLAAGGLHILHRRVHGGREQKHDADFFETGGQNRGGQTDLDAQGFHDVGRAAFGSQAAVAVLGHAHACAGDDERRGGGDIEGAAARLRRCRRCRPARRAPCR